MLGKLFSSTTSSRATSPSSTRPSSIFESSQEERRTLGLLFPGGSPWPVGSLQVTDRQSRNCDDDNGEFEIEAKRDVRVVVAQDRGPHAIKNLIFDTHPPPKEKTRLSKLQAAQEDPIPPALSRVSSFGGQRRNRSSWQSTTSNGSEASPAHGGVPSKADDEMRNVIECMFGTTAMSYKGSSTKMHILPSSFGQWSTRADIQQPAEEQKNPETKFKGANHSPTKSKESVASEASIGTSVLVTRMFSVLYPSSTSRDVQTPASETAGQGYPFPKMSQNSKGVKPVRAGTFAVGVIIRFPKTKRSQFSPQKAHSGSVRSSEWLSSSLKSTSFLQDPLFSADSPLGASSDSDDKIDIISLHWEVINRCLYTIQKQVHDQVRDMLRKLASSPSAGSARRNMELVTGALSYDPNLKAVVDDSRERLVLGLKIPRVVTGQARWDRWREEARDVYRWSGGKEHNFFFYVLLNSFLGYHTDWLDVLGPAWHRRRHRKQVLLMSTKEETIIPNKTVLVGTDKAALRRLLFLLSFFLPASATNESLESSSLRHRPSLPINSFRSPESSLRRKPYQRTSVLRPHPDGQGHINLIAWNLAADANVDATPSPGSSPVTRSANLPIPVSEARKNSTATTATLTPVNTAGFLSSGSGLPGTGPEPRPESSGSLASINLMHQLRRAEPPSYSLKSESPKRWSGIFNVFRGEKARPDYPEGLRSPLSPHRRTFSDLSNPANVRTSDDFESPHSPVVRTSYDSGRFAFPPLSPLAPVTPVSAPRPLNVSIDASDGVIDVDVALPSLLDVSSSSVPSWPSTMGNSWLTDETRTSGSQLSVCPITDADANSAMAADLKINVSGVLSKVHPDFCLQAVLPYNGLDQDIRASLMSEPVESKFNSFAAVGSPGANELAVLGKWVDVSNMIVADTRDFRIKLYRLRRRRVQGGNTENEKVESEIVEEPIMDFDTVICDAVERLVNTRAGIDLALSASSGSAMSSRENSRRGHLSGTHTPVDHGSRVQPTSLREHTRTTIVHALEEIVRIVSSDRDAAGRANEADDGSSLKTSQQLNTTKTPNTNTNTTTTATAGLGKLFKRISVSESTVREGVRRWLESVEEAADARPGP